MILNNFDQLINQEPSSKVYIIFSCKLNVNFIFIYNNDKNPFMWRYYDRQVIQ